MTTMMKLSILFVAWLVPPTCQAFVAQPRVGHHAASSTTTTSLGMGLLNRFRERRQVQDQPKDPIAVGSVLPDVDVERFVGASADGGVATASAQAVSILEAVKTNDKALLIGMPGAFTPVCHQEHLPGYLSKAKAFRKLGVEKIAIVTTNDSFVNEAWRQAQGLDTKEGGDDDLVVLLSDGDADFCKAIGLAVDQGFGMGVRAGRFAMVLDSKGKVLNLVREQEGGMEACSETSADAMLALLAPQGVAVDGESEVGGAAALAGGVIAVGLALALAGMMGDSSSSSPEAGFSLLNQYAQ